MSLSAPKSAARQAPAWKKPGTAATGKPATVFTPEPEAAAATTENKTVLDDITEMLDDGLVEQDVDEEAEQALRDQEAEERKQKAEERQKADEQKRKADDKHKAEAKKRALESSEQSSAAKKPKTTATATAAPKPASKPSSPKATDKPAANRYQSSLNGFMKKPAAVATKTAEPAGPSAATIEKLVEAINAQSERAKGGFQAALDAMAQQQQAAIASQLTAIKEFGKYIGILASAATESKQDLVDMIRALKVNLVEDRNARERSFETSLQSALHAGMSQEVEQAKQAISEFVVQKFAEMQQDM